MDGHGKLCCDWHTSDKLCHSNIPAASSGSTIKKCAIIKNNLQHLLEKTKAMWQQQKTPTNKNKVAHEHKKHGLFL